MKNKRKKFKMYIGDDFSKNGGKYFAKIDPEFVVPSGNCSINGELIERGIQYFKTVENCIYYFADWFDIVEKNQIYVKIFINKISCSKIFYGEEIIKILEIISQCKEINKIRNFNELICHNN